MFTLNRFSAGISSTLTARGLLCLFLSTGLVAGCDSNKASDKSENSEDEDEDEDEDSANSENEDEDEDEDEEESGDKKKSEDGKSSEKSEEDKEEDEKSKDKEKSEKDKEKSEEDKEGDKSKDKDPDPDPDPKESDRDCTKIAWGSGKSLVEGQIIPRTDAKGFVDKDGDNVIEEEETDADMCQLHLSGRKCGFIIYGDTG